MVELDSDKTADTAHKARHSLEGSENGELSRQMKAQRCLCVAGKVIPKELVPFTQLIKVRRGKLVLALPSIRFS